MTPETCNSPETEEAQAVNVALAPCPFCGGTKLHTHNHFVHCDECFADGPEFDHRDGADCRTQAIAAWNRRAAPALPQDVAALVERLRAYPRDRNGNFDILSYTLTGEEAASLILSQSSTIASAREVIDQIAEGSIDVSATAIIVGWPTARTVLDAARDWKER
ncbi:Lar family restriction alleviation protein [Mesorhizobium sp. Pch-S]|uniref:Lar family restriction alleviation protein n=1 Tax=Mesorhizobium sp. Pch-S TaxID=2082387 RepID=UPI0010107F15|nr:Lar family restriction alleviation protein [Mesorhizobium sp. Pch-S]QAZ46797.1 hypothetical protein C1M53_31590 [Mesorhizobium sp. Pch-S]